MKRGIIDPDKIQDQALDQEYGKARDEELYYYVVKTIKEAIDDIDEAGRKITIPRITQRIQLQFPGITRDEVWNTYSEEITAYSEQYD